MFLFFGCLDIEGFGGLDIRTLAFACDGPGDAAASPLDDSCVFSKIAAKFGRELRNAERGYVNVAMSCRLQGGECIELDSLHERLGVGRDWVGIDRQVTCRFRKCFATVERMCAKGQ